MLFSRYYTCIFLLGEWCSFDFSPVGAGRAAWVSRKRRDRWIPASRWSTGYPCDIYCCMDFFITTPIFFCWLVNQIYITKDATKYHLKDVSAGYLIEKIGWGDRSAWWRKTYHLWAPRSHDVFKFKRTNWLVVWNMAFIFHHIWDTLW